MKINIKKKNKEKFTEYCGGEVTEDCILKAKNSNNPTLRKRAVFAENAKKWSRKYQEGGLFNIDFSDPLVLQRYISLLNSGVRSLVAFDTAHLSLVEDSRPGKYYSFGKRANSLDEWSKNATDSLTVGRYKNLLDSTSFNLFKQGLKSKNYNTRPVFYNIEINRNRNKNKDIVNRWNSEHNISPIAYNLINMNNLG